MGVGGRGKLSFLDFLFIKIERCQLSKDSGVFFSLQSASEYDIMFFKFFA